MNLPNVFFVCTALTLFSANTHKVTNYLKLDSTVDSKSKNAYPEYGWEERLHNFINGKATIHNYAANGNGTFSLSKNCSKKRVSTT